jgi:hypothetical protein
MDSAGLAETSVGKSALIWEVEMGEGVESCRVQRGRKWKRKEKIGIG